MLGNDIMTSLKMVILTFVFSVCIMPIMKKIAHHIGAIDIPRTNEGNRHIHKKPIPKLGGVGIFFAFLFGYMLFGQHSIKMNAILIGSFIIVLEIVLICLENIFQLGATDGIDLFSCLKWVLRVYLEKIK